MPHEPRLFDDYLDPAVGSAAGAPPPAAPPALQSSLPPAPPRAEDVPTERSAETGCRVAGPFLAFWNNFGATLCGEPLTEEILVDGRRAQVFERLVLAEIEPGRAAPLDVGAEWLAVRSNGHAPVGEALVITDCTAELAARPPADVASTSPGVPPTASYPHRPLGEIRYIVVHHTGAAPEIGWAAIDREHREVLGWPGIGYHFVVDADGGIHQTQDLTVASHHARQFNAVSVGVALCGDFQAVPPPPGQLDRAAALIAHLIDRLGLPLDAVRGHGDLVGTDCPGATFRQGWQPALAQAVARYAGRPAPHAEARAIVPAGAAP